MSDNDSDEVLEVEGQKRKDYRPANVAPKGKAKREAQERYDSPPAPVDGWGDPFAMQCAPGWRACWVSEHDAAKLSHRQWEIGTWGDPRILSYAGARPGDKGEAIKFRELTCYLMSEEAALREQANDPKRQRHSQLREVLFRQAEESTAGGRSGKARTIQQTL